jgi:DGQHR domain-containing protein
MNKPTILKKEWANMSDTPGLKISFRVLEIEQPIGVFYVGVMNALDVYTTSFADARQLKDRDMDLYIGIQRPLNAQRLQEISKYIANVDATFPTGIILSTTSTKISFNRVNMTVEIERRGDIFTILDGQHRVVAFEDKVTHGQPISFQVPVMIFVDMDVEDQAQVFATINLAQTKVNKSLAYDLFEFERDPSPQKTAHQVARLLNRHLESPYKQRVKILGTADNVGEVITQAAIVDQLLPMITEDKRADRDLIKRGKWPTNVGLGKSGKTVFRRMWCEHRDEQIGVTMLRFFGEVSIRWQEAWKSQDRGVMLSRTNGFIACMTLLREFLVQKGLVLESPSRAEFKELLDRVDLQDSDFTVERFKPGSSGQSDLAAELRRALR